MKKMIAVLILGFVSVMLAMAQPNPRVNPQMSFTEVRNNSDKTITVIFARNKADRVVLIYPGQKFNVPVMTTVTISDGQKLYTYDAKSYYKQNKRDLYVAGDKAYGCMAFQYGRGTPYVWTTDTPSSNWD